MSYVFLALAASALLCILWYYWFRRRHRYIGAGWVLNFKNDDGTVYVETRLLKSPAGVAGVHLGDRLVTYNGVDIAELNLGDIALSEERFKKLKQALGFRDHRKGDWIDCILERNGELISVNMHADVIQGPIPIYALPPMIEPEDKHLLRTHVQVCEKTGVWVVTQSLSEHAINLVTERRNRNVCEL